MDEHQHDDEISEPHSDGELSEDALFEWDGQDWVSVEHDPFYGYDEPQEWIEPPRQIYPPPRPIRNVEEYVAPVEKESRFASLKVFGGVLIAMFALIMVLSNRQGGDNRTVSQVVGGSATPTRSSTATPSPTSTPLAAELLTLCDDSFYPAYAYIFTSGQNVVAQSMERENLSCQLTGSEFSIDDARLAPDGESVFFLADGRIFVTGLERGYGNTVVGLNVEGIDGFDVTTTGDEIVFTENGVMQIYYPETSVHLRFTRLINNFSVSHPRWSPDGREIMVLAGAQIVRVSADRNDDYTVIYQNHNALVEFFRLAWSLDGTKIAVLYVHPTNFEVNGQVTTILMVMSHDGLNAREVVTDLSMASHDLTWLPDGQHIAVFDNTLRTITVYDLEGNITETVNQASP